MNMSRLIVLFTLTFALPLLAAKRPNILFIYTDDQSTRTVGCYDEAFKFARTPNIDALAKAGVRFEKAYLGAPKQMRHGCEPRKPAEAGGLEHRAAGDVAGAVAGVIHVSGSRKTRLS